MLARLIMPDWALKTKKINQRVLEGRFSPQDLSKYNKLGYNVYYLPNYPKKYDPNATVDGTHIDTWEWVFCDMDLKDGDYQDKEQFFQVLSTNGIPPTKVIDSGNGIHAYWRVLNLDAMGFLRFQRRLARHYCTDLMVSKLFQLMRMPGFLNTKRENNQVLCESLFEDEVSYTAEELDKLLPPITMEDENYCKQHYERTYSLNQDDISEALPAKFGELLQTSKEAKELFSAPSDDRSRNDYRLGHLMLAKDFTREEALSVLVNAAKALNRSPVHRRSYALGIVDKIWTYEQSEDKEQSDLSESVESILSRSSDEDLKGMKFPCTPHFDGTTHGFRLGQVIGLCAGVGVGKTAVALNLFKGFVELNPDYIHMFVSLEQPGREIAARWKKMCGANRHLHSKVHILSNYNKDGSYRNLSLQEIQDYILAFQTKSKLKIGCICVDHIGVLKQEDKAGEYQGLRDICSKLKSFAIATETLLIIQSQTNRDKAGIGDLELFKDAAYGSQHFEAFVDFLMVVWQPLKRCYDNPKCPRVTAYKLAKVRFKDEKDVLLEDQCYRLLFDQKTETLRYMTQTEEKSFDFFANKALSLRKKDRKTDVTTYQSTLKEKHETARADSH